MSTMACLARTTWLHVWQHGTKGHTPTRSHNCNPYRLGASIATNGREVCQVHTTVWGAEAAQRMNYREHYDRGLSTGGQENLKLTLMVCVCVSLNLPPSPPFFPPSLAYTLPPSLPSSPIPSLPPSMVP